MRLRSGQSPVVAVDGPAAAGKGTLARRLAAHLGFAYLDTGLLYRAVAARTLEHAGSTGSDAAADRLEVIDDAIALQAALTLRPEDLARADLRTESVAAAASRVAAVAEVRSALLDFQRRFAEAPPAPSAGAVLDGRDIGTVVCPRADLKLFVTASLQVRAARRLKELRDRGVEAIDSRVLRDMQERDARDSMRSVAPLEPAVDAVVIDTSELGPDAVFAAAMAVWRASRPSG